MKKILIQLAIVVLILSKSISSFAQYTFFKPEGSFAIEVSLENTDLKRLPIYRNAITSLAVVNKIIIGGTSANEGMSPFLFLASLEMRKVIEIFDLNHVIEGQNSIRSGFVKDNNNQLFAGTIPDKIDQAGGHLLKIKISRQGKVQVEDLGIPVVGEGIFTLTSDNEFEKLYGISYPSGYFFSFDIKSGKTKVFKNMAPDKKVVHSLNDQFSLNPEDLLSNALIASEQGFIYGSLPYGKLFYFDPTDETMHKMEIELPEVWGRRSLGQVQCWLKTKDGKLYGGNHADGQLFEINPMTRQIKNIGKPIMMPGIKGLAEGADGKIYGISGESPGYSHLFCYDEQIGFKDYGNPEFKMTAPGIEQGILWRGFQLETIAVSDDGKYIVMGEGESLSQLLVFPVK